MIPKSFDIPPIGHYDKYTTNPILPGNTLPENIVYDEKTGKYWMLYGFGSNLAYSDDLVNWTIHGSIIKLSESGWDSSFFDTSHLHYYNGKYYLYYNAYEKKDNVSKGRIGLAIADSITGPYAKHPANPMLDHGPDGKLGFF